MDALLARGLSPKDASIMCRNEFPLISRQEFDRGMRELEPETADLPDELRHILEAMKPGQDYRTHEIFPGLPSTHPIFKIKALKGRETKLGQMLESLNRMGKVIRQKGRYATFRLPELAQVIPIR